MKDAAETESAAPDHPRATPSSSFAELDPDRLRALASQGGRTAHANGRAHEFTSEEARLAGRKGGLAVSQDREHMSKLGKKGGAKTAAKCEHMAQIARLGGEKRSADREAMAAMGRLGGQASGRRRREKAAQRHAQRSSIGADGEQGGEA